MKSLAWLLRGLNVLDIVTTLVLLRWGAGHEMNPVMAWLLALGPQWFVAFKLAAVECLLWFALTRPPHRWLRLALQISAAGYVLVALNNLTGLVLTWSRS